MPATLSSSGTFTTLSTDLTKIQDTALPAPTSVTIAPADLQTIPDEIPQMVKVFQAGWGTQLGAGKRLDFAATARLLAVMLQTYTTIGLPRSGN